MKQPYNQVRSLIYHTLTGRVEQGVKTAQGCCIKEKQATAGQINASSAFNLNKKYEPCFWYGKAR